MNKYQRTYACGAEDLRCRSAMRERAIAEAKSEAASTDCGMTLAMAYVRSQPFENIYSAEDGFGRGTIFADLDKPYEGGCRTC
ncbi:MAG: spore coat associated protein CotJA [Clostridia bacterium]|nr:spore coat associated protein CotJA [Clostridia bacterium]